MVVKICIMLLNICNLINCLYIRYVYKTLNNELIELKLKYKEDLNKIVRAIYDGNLKEIKTKKKK